MNIRTVFSKLEDWCAQWNDVFPSKWPLLRCSDKAMNRVWMALLPELRQFPPVWQNKVLERARESQLEPREKIAIVVWLVIVTFSAKAILIEGSMADDVSATLVINLLLVAPLLALVFVPIHIRRLRRGLRKQLEGRENP